MHSEEQSEDSHHTGMTSPALILLEFQISFFLKIMETTNISYVLKVTLWCTWPWGYV